MDNLNVHSNLKTINWDFGIIVHNSISILYRLCNIVAVHRSLSLSIKHRSTLYGVRNKDNLVPLET
jgi:hypothetical protein